MNASHLIPDALSGGGVTLHAFAYRFQSILQHSYHLIPVSCKVLQPFRVPQV